MEKVEKSLSRESLPPQRTSNEVEVSESQEPVKEDDAEQDGLHPKLVIASSNQQPRLSQGRAALVVYGKGVDIVPGMRTADPFYTQEELWEGVEEFEAIREVAIRELLRSGADDPTVEGSMANDLHRAFGLLTDDLNEVDDEDCSLKRSSFSYLMSRFRG